MTNTPEFRPDWASPPGATIADILEERSISVAQFARWLDRSPDDVQALLDGRTSITIALARRLGQTLGGSLEFWMARDFQYRADIGRIYKDEQDWLQQLPIGDMIKFGWLSPLPHPRDEAEACLRFFGVPRVQAWRELYLESPALSAFRTSASFDSSPGAVAAWLRQGTIVGESIECAPWNPDGFRDSLTAIRRLTRVKEPARFLKRLEQMCSLRGVAVAVLRAPSGCRASGAATFLSPKKGLIILSVRHLSDDHFWFTFFHEAAHLLLHGDQGLFIDGEPTPTTQVEQEANDLAARVLIPPKYKEDMLQLPAQARAVIRFARRIEVSPGIVVGQLQHLGRLGYNQLNSLKRRFEWVDQR